MIKSNSIRFSSRIAIWSVVFVIGVQPMSMMNSNCVCGSQLYTAESSCCDDADGNSNSCCSEQIKSSCWATDLSRELTCNCGVDTQSCECDGCSCSANDLPVEPIPATPAKGSPNKTHSNSDCLVEFCIDVDRSRELNEKCDRAFLSQARSAQQICILLSRFTC